MKNTKIGLSAVAVSLALFAFSAFEGGSIKGKITPIQGTTQVWAMSKTDTLKVIVSQGMFEIANAKPGTYKVYIDATEPYQDVVKEGVQVAEGSTTDLGEISLQK